MPLPGDLTTITVTSSYPNVAGQPQSGYVTFDPGAVLADSTGKVILTGAVRCEVFNGIMQSASLPCTDNAGLNPTGFAYTVTETIGVNKRSYQVMLPHTLGASVDLSSLSPVVAPPAATAFASNNTWTGTQTFDGNPPLVIPAGAVSGYVLTSDANGDASWEPSTGGGGGLTNPMTGVGDTIYGGASGVPTRLAAQTAAAKRFLTETGTGSAGQAPAWSAIVAGDVPTLNQNTTGTAGNVTATLDQVPAPAANVALAGHKITGLANGTASSDAVAFGQVPASASTIGGLLAASNLSDVANAATSRTNLGLGSAATQASAVFAQVANNLSDLVSASTARTNLGLGSAATQATSAFAQTANNLSDLSNAGTARTNLGLGTSATHAATDFLAVAGGTLTGWLAPAVATLTFGSTIAVNAALGNSFVVTLTASTGTLANPTNPVDGQTIRVRIVQDATGSRTLAYGTAYDFGAASAPTLSIGANKVDILGFEYVASLSKWCYLGSGLGF